MFLFGLYIGLTIGTSIGVVLAGTLAAARHSDQEMHQACEPQAEAGDAPQ